MKTYSAPEMETLAFASEETVAGTISSDVLIDAEFGAW